MRLRSPRLGCNSRRARLGCGRKGAGDRRRRRRVGDHGRRCGCQRGHVDGRRGCDVCFGDDLEIDRRNGRLDRPALRHLVDVRSLHGRRHGDVNVHRQLGSGRSGGHSNCGRNLEPGGWLGRRRRSGFGCGCGSVSRVRGRRGDRLGGRRHLGWRGPGGGRGFGRLDLDRRHDDADVFGGGVVDCRAGRGRALCQFRHGDRGWGAQPPVPTDLNPDVVSATGRDDRESVGACGRAADQLMLNGAHLAERAQRIGVEHLREQALHGAESQALTGQLDRPGSGHDVGFFSHVEDQGIAITAHDGGKKRVDQRHGYNTGRDCPGQHVRHWTPGSIRPHLLFRTLSVAAIAVRLMQDAPRRAAT